MKERTEREFRKFIFLAPLIPSQRLFLTLCGPSQFLSQFLYHAADSAALLFARILSTLNYRTTTVVVVKKSKAVPLHAMKAHGGRGGIAPTHS
jgi:hypothetical protein